MDWKAFWYKVIKGGIGGAAASLAALQLAGVPHEKYIPVLVATAITGALHGITNAMEQKKAEG